MIDPQVLETQRSAKPRHEGKCRQCRKRTTDQSGLCASCRRAGVVNFTRHSTEALLGMLSSIREELEKRSAEAKAAVEMATNACRVTRQETERDG